VGVSVPDALSIIGIGDFKGSEDMEPALTTIRIPARRIGEVAGKLIVSLVVDDEHELQRMQITQSEVIRATTAPNQS
jgi:LacI family transcriptional regulator